MTISLADSFRVGLIGLWLSVFASGCAPGQEASSHVTMPAADDRNEPSVVSGTDAIQAPHGPAPGSGGITLRVADSELFQQVLDQHEGKVVLVDFWATWCLPCKKNFPKIVGYGEKYKQQGLAIISVSMDDPSAQADALRFLTSVKAIDTNLISKWGAGSQSAERFEFSGEVPFYRLYDRLGELRYEFSSNAASLKDIEPLEQIELRIRELLDQPRSR